MSQDVAVALQRGMMHVCWRAGRWEQEHGAHCSCRLLAVAARADPRALDYGFCRGFLQKRWRMTCDHFPQQVRKKTTPDLPPHDSRDAIHLLLLANADLPSD